MCNSIAWLTLSLSSVFSIGIGHLLIERIDLVQQPPVDQSLNPYPLSKTSPGGRKYADIEFVVQNP